MERSMSSKIERRLHCGFFLAASLNCCTTLSRTKSNALYAVTIVSAVFRSFLLRLFAQFARMRASYPGDRCDSA